MFNEARKEILFALLRDLVRTPSLSGEEGACARLTQKRMPGLGLTGVRTDVYGNVIGRVDFPGTGPTLLLEAHLDHVGVSNVECWNHYPYGGEVSEGHIWGRGAMDNKGALAAMLVAASMAAAEPAGLGGVLYVAASVYNERLEGAASAGIAEICRPDLVIIGEASDHCLMHGQRGRAEILLETRGRSAISAMPGQGVNAVGKMIRLIAALEERRRPLPPHPVLGGRVMELTSISSAPSLEINNVVPDRCRARFDLRFPVGETRGGVLDHIQAVIDDLAAADPDFKARAALAVNEYRCYTGAAIGGEVFMPAWLLPPEHPLVAAAVRGLTGAGLPAPLSVYPFSTNGSYYAGILGRPTIGFGPRDMARSHLDNECVNQNDLVDLCRGYHGLIRAILETP